MATLNTAVDVKRDDIFVGADVNAITKNVAITAGKTLVKGTLMTIESGTAVATAKDSVADSVLASDVNTTDTVATVYVTGRFAKDALIAASDDIVEAHEEELRKIGIFMSERK